MKTTAFALTLFLLMVTTTSAARPLVQRNVPYAGTDNARQTLDIYSTGGRKADKPVMVWIHGGAWRFGNKSAVQQKPQAFTDRGFVFVSINYRLVPEVAVGEQASDVATAIAWVRDHIKEFGGSPEKIVVGGHSAGAHLAALVCTDLSYLKAAKVPPRCVKACVPVDTAVLDVAAQIAARRFRKPRLYTSVFGDDATTQKKHSPIEFVDDYKTQIPPFCILHVASRADSTARAQAFAEKLQDAGVMGKVVAGKNKTHETINKELGEDGDLPTVAMFAFLEEVFSD